MIPPIRFGMPNSPTRSGQSSIDSLPTPAQQQAQQPEGDQFQAQGSPVHPAINHEQNNERTPSGQMLRRPAVLPGAPKKQRALEANAPDSTGTKGRVYRALFPAP